MKKRITNFLKITAITLGLLTIISPVLATAGTPVSDACSAITSVSGQACDKASGDSAFSSIIITVVNVLTVIVGAVSVIMIIIGGFRYVVSNGDSNGMQGAKNTILYAIVGLVIALSAQLIVAFVIDKS